MNGQLESALSSILKSVLLDVAREVFPKVKSNHASDSHAKAAPERLLLRASEVAKLLAISERHLHSLTQSGDLPCVRVGRVKRYCPHTIQEWIRRTEGNEKEPSQALASPSGDQLPKAVKQPAQKQTTATRKIRPQPKELASPSIPDAGNTTPKQSRQQDLSNSQPRNVISFLAQRVGVSENAMPRMTNGELMKIAEVDIATMHGWLYLNRDMPDEAIDKLVRHFRDYFRHEHSSDTA